MKSFSVILLASSLLFSAVTANATAVHKAASPEPTAAKAVFSDNKMLINTPFKGEQTVTVTDRNGTQLGSFKVKAKAGMVSIPSVTSTGAPVIYQVDIQGTDGKVITKKVLVF